MNKRFYLLLALVLGCVGMICAQPSVGKIYYMKGALSQKYLKASGTSLSLSAEKTTDCLFYVDADNAIKAYLTSNYINCSGKNLSTAKYPGEFTEGSGGRGKRGDEGEARVSISSDDTDNSTDMWGAGW